ncbi:MAG: hypothetical protein GQ570_00305 [Helicobacteraceae bacterium]|nr:hypothetical protein [Helicobacteraceae bacterium]
METIVVKAGKTLVSVSQARAELQTTTDNVVKHGKVTLVVTSISTPNTTTSSTTTTNTNTSSPETPLPSCSTKLKAVYKEVDGTVSEVNSTDGNITLGGYDKNITFEFSQTVTTAGLSITSSKGATLGSLTLSNDTNISFTYLVPASLADGSYSYSTMEVLTASQNDCTYDTKTFEIAYDLNETALSMDVSDLFSTNQYGMSLAINNNRLFIGSRDENSLFIYDLNATDINGSRVQISYSSRVNQISASGNFMIVGVGKSGVIQEAYLYETNRTLSDIANFSTKLTNDGTNGYYATSGINTNTKYAFVADVRSDIVANDAGAVYVYELNTSLVDVNATSKKDDGSIIYIKANDGSSSDYFGSAIASNSAYLAISAPYKDNGGNNAGAIYIFELNTTSNLPVPIADISATQQKLTANTPVAKSYLGISMAMNSKYLVACTNNGENAIYLWEVNSTTSTQGNIVDITATQLKLTGNGAGSGFGRSVAMNDKYLVVGDKSATSVYIFDLTLPKANINDSQIKLTNNSLTLFGWSVAVDNNFTAVGTNNGKKVELFENPTTTK